MDKDFDNLGESPVAVASIEKPKPASEFLEPYCKTLGNGTQDYLGIKTGLNDLDKKTLGLDGLIVLGGIAGGGKTSLALQLAYGACELGTPTIFYSLEMPRRAIFTKILNRLAEVRYSDILLKGGQCLDETRKNEIPLGEGEGYYKFLSTQDKENLKKAKAKLLKISEKFYLRSRESEEADISFKAVEREINLVKTEHNNAEKVFVVIDHLQVFPVDRKDYKDQIDKEGFLIKSFKDISEKTGATIFLISQKNKAGYNTAGVQTIKGSIDIIYLADVVMSLMNTEQKEDPTLNAEIARFGGGVLKKIDLNIEKNRYNAPSKIELDFNGEYSSFTERKD